MKKTISITSILLLSAFLLVSYSQSWKSSNILQGTDNISVIKSRIDSEGNIYVFGFFVGTLQPNTGDDITSLGSRDYFLIKFNQSGDNQWIKHLGGPSFEYINGGIDIDSDNNVYISGGYRNYLKYSPTDSLVSSGGFDLFIAKYNPLGDIIWIRNTGEGVANQRPTSLRVDLNNDLILNGFFSDSISLNRDTTLYSSDGVDDYFYSKFENVNGDLLWAKQIKAISNENSGRLTSVAILNDAYVFSGFFADSIVIENDTIVAKSDLYDIHLIKTDLLGNQEWIRTIKGNQYEYTFGVVNDPSGNLYCSGYYNSDTITIQSNETESIDYNINNGLYDFLMAKYSSSGDLLWFRANGGKGEDKLFDAKYYNNEFVVAGHFADTLFWGGIQLSSIGVNDVDMFIGNMDADGNYRSSNSFAGRDNSWEEANAVFDDGVNSYTIIRSNSDLLVLGDSVYTSATGNFYVALGIIGCLPISVDNTIYNDVETCFGDSTGSIQISATGGFGSPWTYSIDNGLTSSANPFFGDLPAEDYQVVVVDQEGCAQTGPLVALTQPDTLEVQVVSTEDITDDHDGSIVVVAQGGSAPYTYWLQPDGAIQGFGTFTFATGDSGTYVVAVDDLNGCGPVETDSLLIQEIIIPIDTTGFETLSGVKARVYPNPTSGNLTVEMPFEGRKCQMEVISMTGQVVLKRKVFSNGGVINETLDLSDQAKGLYMLRIDGQTLQSAIMVK